MHIVRQNLYEKFSEEGDPIKDLGIGEVVVRIPIKVAQHEKRPSWTWTSDYINYAYANKLPELIKKLELKFETIEPKNVNDRKSFVEITGIRKNVIEFIKKFFQYSDKQINDIMEGNLLEINEKFTEDLDPIKDLGIGSIDIYQRAQELITSHDEKGLKSWLEYMKSLHGKIISGYFRKGNFGEPKGQLKYYEFKIKNVHSYMYASSIHFKDESGQILKALEGEKYKIRDEVS